MPDLVVTGSQVLPGAGAILVTRVAAVAITPGQVLYVNSSSLWALAQADGTAEEAAAVGIALNTAAAGQPVQAVTGGLVTLGAGAAPAVGQIYVVSVTAGGIGIHSELVTTNRVTILGIGKATNQLDVAINVTGVLRA